MQICDGYSQSSAPRELLKPNRRRSQHPEKQKKGRQGTMLYPSPTKLPWREAALTPYKRLFDSRNSVGVRHHCGRADRRLGHVHLARRQHRRTGSGNRGPNGTGNGIRLVIIVIRLRKCPSLLYGMLVLC